MSNVFHLNNPRPGDRLVLPKSEWNLIQHHVIYIGIDANGNRLYIENFAGKGVQLENEKHLFRDGYYVTRIEPFVGDLFQRNEAIKRAMQLIGKLIWSISTVNIMPIQYNTIRATAIR